MKDLCKNQDKTTYIQHVQPRDNDISNQDFKRRDYSVKDRCIRHIKIKHFNGKEPQ